MWLLLDDDDDASSSLCQGLCNNLKALFSPRETEADRTRGRACHKSSSSFWLHFLLNWWKHLLVNRNLISPSHTSLVPVRAQCLSVAQCARAGNKDRAGINIKPAAFCSAGFFGYHKSTFSFTEHLVSISPCRQHGQRGCAPEGIQPADTGCVPPSHRNKRQRLSRPEQHQHPDHPRLLLRQQKHHPVLQRGALRSPSRTQHRGSDRHIGLYRYSAGWVQKHSHQRLPSTRLTGRLYFYSWNTHSVGHLWSWRKTCR